jgi:hypothetical protein
VITDAFFGSNDVVRYATFRITGMAINGTIHTAGFVALKVWDGVTNFNPFAVLEAILSLQFNAMGRTSEVFASGIQSVATGVGSASSLALHKLSAVNLTAHRSSSPASQSHGHRNGSGSKDGGGANKRLLRKLTTINKTAKVVAYKEGEDDTGGLKPSARSRVQRMLHYDVSLRPFVATVSTKGLHNLQLDSTLRRNSSEGSHTVRRSSISSSTGSPLSISSFLYTPHSFPPTPHSRGVILARGNKFSDNVVFLARDQLRVHDGMESENERTRDVAQALRQSKQLAVFDAKDVANGGIELSCGQHLAKKVGVVPYCSARSMIPILRNSWVYFEMFILPSPSGRMVAQGTMTTLSIGLATGEMPSSHLLGAWSGSVGLTNTGQILLSGHWCTAADLSRCMYGDNTTVGCLVCLDDSTACETWDGVM